MDRPPLSIGYYTSERVMALKSAIKIAHASLGSVDNNHGKYQISYTKLGSVGPLAPDCHSLVMHEYIVFKRIRRRPVYCAMIRSQDSVYFYHYHGTSYV